MNKVLKKEFRIAGLDCAHCANKIEEEISKLDFVREAYLDFVSKKLIVKVDAATDCDILGLISETASKIEDGVEFTEYINSENLGEDKISGVEKSIIIIGSLIFATALIGDFARVAEFMMFLVSYILIGGEVLLKAGKNILKGQVFDENFLMSISTIGAFAIGEYPEGVAVMLFYKIGELLQKNAVNHSRRSIKALMDIRPDYANLKSGNDYKKVAPDEVNIGDVILIKPGEKVPLDGKVVDGESVVDTSAITGESVPRKAAVGDDVYSGSINLNSLISLQVSKKFNESTISKILELVENANSKKSTVENFITKFARVYTPAVVGIAFLIAILPLVIIEGASFDEWLYRALVFLVISCPCALVISIPLGFFSGIGVASRKGILIKGSNFLEALNSVDRVIFDKTGTLTKGIFDVSEIKSQGELSEEEILKYAAFAESYSNHPIALSISKAYSGDLDYEKVDFHEELPGYGVRVGMEGKELLVGNAKLMKKEKIDISQNEDKPGTYIYIALDKKFIGTILIADEVRADSSETVKELKKIGISKVIMLTGDNAEIADEIGGELGVDEVFAELLPHQKVEMMKKIEQREDGKKKTLFVGDGINDAPILANSDIGVAMGGLGADAAIEASDIVIMKDTPFSLIDAINIAKKTRKIVTQNIVVILLVKLIVLSLGAIGLATMWEAVFADVGISLIAVFNSMRILKMERS